MNSLSGVLLFGYIIHLFFGGCEKVLIFKEFFCFWAIEKGLFLKNSICLVGKNIFFLFWPYSWYFILGLGLRSLQKNEDR